MASGCIVFTTKNKNSLEIIENNKNGFFIESNNISNKVENLLENPEQKRLLKMDMKQFEKIISLEKLLKTKIRIYNSLII